jgi:hypothetical protein
MVGMTYKPGPIHYLSKHQTPITLYKVKFKTDKYGTKRIKSKTEYEIMAVIVQIQATETIWHTGGDYTGGLAELYIDLDTLTVEIEPHNTYVKQDNNVYKIKSLTEYSKYYNVGIYLIELQEDSIADI